MMLATFQQFAADNWKGALEILILAVCIYYGYLGLRGTRGLRVLTGLAVLVLGLALLSQLFGLGVISWLLRSLSAIVVLASWRASACRGTGESAICGAILSALSRR